MARRRQAQLPTPRSGLAQSDATLGQKLFSSGSELEFRMRLVVALLNKSLLNKSIENPSFIRIKMCDPPVSNIAEDRDFMVGDGRWSICHDAAP
jgi:hypothetical protein